jgi:hypothetical protein
MSVTEIHNLADNRVPRDQIHCFPIRCRPVHYECNLEVRRLLKAGILEPEKTAFSREQLTKHVSKATTKSCDRGNRYCNVDDKALLGNDSVKQQWKLSNRCHSMTQYTHVNNGDEDVFCVVGAVVISRV